MTTQMFGAPIQRKEDPRLVTGGGRYLDDLGQNALAAAFVRSPHAHARITDIDVTDAVEVPGVVAIYTWDDLPGKVAEPLPLLIPHPTLTHGRTGYALARDEVNHVGEPVVMVVATDRYAAEDACQRIAAYDADVLVISLGVDTFKDDPISQFKLDSPDYLEMGKRIAQLGKPTLFVMEGGYAVEEIGTNAVNVLEGFQHAQPGAR